MKYILMTLVAFSLSACLTQREADVAAGAALGVAAGHLLTK